MENFKRFFSDYGLAFIGVIILVTELILDFLGIQIKNGFTFAFMIFAILLMLQALKPQMELNKHLKSRPHIIVKNAYPKKNVPTTDFIRFSPGTYTETSRYSGGTVSPMEYKQAFRNKYGDSDDSDIETTEQTFVIVEFQNNPERRNKIHDAIDVIARVNYFDEQEHSILGKEIKGLWAGIEPSRIITPKQDYEYTQITIPANGDERTLCIGIKQRNEEYCFAYSLESYRGGKFLKNEELNLGTGIIRVDIILSGSNLDDEEFSFRLVNPGKGRDISITRIV